MHGTQTASRIYTDRLEDHLKKHNDEQADADPNIFSKHDAHGTLITAVSMDDFFVITKNTKPLSKLYGELQQKYNLKWLGFSQQYLTWTI